MLLGVDLITEWTFQGKHWYYIFDIFYSTYIFELTLLIVTKIYRGQYDESQKLLIKYTLNWNIRYLPILMLLKTHSLTYRRILLLLHWTLHGHEVQVSKSNSSVVHLQVNGGNYPIHSKYYNYMYKPLTYYHNKPNSILGMNFAGPRIKYLTFWG